MIESKALRTRHLIPISIRVLISHPFLEKLNFLSNVELPVFRLHYHLNCGYFCESQFWEEGMVNPLLDKLEKAKERIIRLSVERH